MPVECGICTESYFNGRVLSALSCGHVLHQECYQKWKSIPNGRFCPNCRAQLADAIPRLYIESSGLSETLYEDLKSENRRFKHELGTLKGLNATLNKHVVELSRTVDESVRKLNVAIKSKKRVDSMLNECELDINELEKKLRVQDVRLAKMQHVVNDLTIENQHLKQKLKRDGEANAKRNESNNLKRPSFFDSKFQKQFIDENTNFDSIFGEFADFLNETITLD